MLNLKETSLSLTITIIFNSYSKFPYIDAGDNLLTALSVARQSGLVLPGQQIIIVKAVMEASSSKAAQHLKVFYYDADQAGGLKNQVQYPLHSGSIKAIR